jgi:hypothetical protein
MPSRDQPERYQRRQVKQDYADLIESNTCVVNCVEGLNRELKPMAMQSVEPVMGKDKEADPDEQNYAV